MSLNPDISCIALARIVRSKKTNILPCHVQPERGSVSQSAHRFAGTRPSYSRTRMPVCAPQRLLAIQQTDRLSLSKQLNGVHLASSGAMWARCALTDDQVCRNVLVPHGAAVQGVGTRGRGKWANGVVGLAVYKLKSLLATIRVLLDPRRSVSTAILAPHKQSTNLLRDLVDFSEWI